MPDQGFQVGIERFEIDAWMTLYRSRGLCRGTGRRFHIDGRVYRVGALKKCWGERFFRRGHCDTGLGPIGLAPGASAMLRGHSSNFGERDGVGRKQAVEKVEEMER